MGNPDLLLQSFPTALQDERVSRGEKKALRALLADDGAGPERRASLRAELFDHVASRIDSTDASRLRGLETAISVLYPAHVDVAAEVSTAARANRGNFLLTSEERTVARFADALEGMWDELGG